MFVIEGLAEILGQRTPESMLESLIREASGDEKYRELNFDESARLQSLFCPDNATLCPRRVLSMVAVPPTRVAFCAKIASC